MLTARHASESAASRPWMRASAVGPSSVHAARQSRLARAAESAAALRAAFLFRQAGGWKLDAIAAQLGADRADVSRWMNGHEEAPALIDLSMPDDVRARWLAAIGGDERRAA